MNQTLLVMDVFQPTSVSPMTLAKMEEHVTLVQTTTLTTTACVPNIFLDKIVLVRTAACYLIVFY